MKKVFVLAIGLTFASVSWAQQPSPPSTASNDVNSKPLSLWMEKKLEFSTAILRGLATEDFAEIESNAEQMRLLNKVEGFVRSRNPEYRRQVQMFEHVTSDLLRQAQNKNLDGVALEFSQLTLSCVRCHQTLREQGEK